MWVFFPFERAEKGEMRVTDKARAILHPASQQEKNETLRWAALEPNLFRELQERFPDMTPPEDGVVTFLNRQGFNQTAIGPAAKAYLETLQFLKEAGASESHGVGADKGPESPMSKGDNGITYGGARVGDLIDYDSSGTIANPEPMRVRALSDYGKWVFVDGSETGLEIDSVIVKDR
ncbi:hypothetical protein [Croceicoccus sp. YJ47]|uniref:hypothetical protein n=1 Tax=Croceicoccus sp. YJ47 TaxID=2798724 RepID=UPI0019238851|nr:hypothetical protein [Croceicoccus sp. YJ47]QQN75036.1 hypothetical protein JD971_04890 [Croceicoccus sp. YJ47]